MNIQLSKDDTLLIKGIAICAMLWHHLFYLHPEYGSFVYQTAICGKLCVAMFLFVSAYGLTIQYNTIQYNTIQYNTIQYNTVTLSDTIKFMMKRFVKFYANYWIIFLIFVPLGIFVFRRHLHDAYGINPKTMLLTDIIGLNGMQSYNITWWFNQIIIVLYLCFPLLFLFSKKWWWIALFISFTLWIINIPIIPRLVNNWFVVFVAGIVIALNINKISGFLNRFNKWILVSTAIIVFLLLIVQRIYNLIPFLTGIKVDAFLAPTIALLSVLLLRNIKYINTIIRLFGKHSINIYMIHTFIFAYWFQDFIYSFKNPILIFAVLMAICMIISIILEYLKKIICLSLLIRKINTKIETIKI